MKNETIEIVNNIEIIKFLGLTVLITELFIINEITVLLIHILNFSIFNGVVPD